MNRQRALATVKPFPDTEELERLAAAHDLIDETTKSPPPISAVQSISNDVDDAAAALTEKIAGLRKQLDALEHQVLSDAADTKHNLSEHIAKCVRHNERISRISDAIDEIAQQFLP